MDVPNGERVRRRAHLDTDVVLHALGIDRDPDLHRPAKDLFFSGKQLVACLSIPTLGELALKVAEKQGRKGVPAAMDWVFERNEEGRLVFFGVEDESAFWTAAEIRSHDARIGPTDALIVAYMIHDSAADVLYTTDGPVLESDALLATLREKGKKVLPLG